MTDAEFIGKMRELDPFYSEGDIELDTLYDRFKTIVAEMGRLEDIEDDRVQMQAHIDYLNEEMAKLKDKNKVMTEVKND